MDKIIAISTRQTTKAEEIIFDKAEEAEELEKTKESLLSGIENLEIAIAEAADKESKNILEEKIKNTRELLKSMEENAKR